MVKTLILIRHSKPENRDSSSNDFDRSLTNEGKSDSMKMGNFLFRMGIIPDFIITSSAVRAYETALILGSFFRMDKKSIIATRKLYYGSAKTLLDQISGLPNKISCPLVVAHNPGISDLTRSLTSGRSFFMDNTQVTLLNYEIEYWFQIVNYKPSKYQIISVMDIK
jgi:phosphohistidine phosphatase